MSFYYKLQVKFKNVEESQIQEIADMAYESYQCLGIEEYSYNEDEIEKIIGEKLFVSGELGHDLVTNFENRRNENINCYNYYFSETAFPKTIEEFLVTIEDNEIKFTYKLTKHKEKEWNDEWKKHYKPIKVSEQLIIVPSWMKDESKINDSHVYIYPGEGFGTGTHETTFLCLKALCDLSDNFPEISNGLDFGCGSGILGISSYKVFGTPFHLFDVDLPALENARLNIELNFNSKDELSDLEIINQISQRYDLIFANIQLNILLAEKEKLLNSLNENGFLILSGVLKTQEEELLNNYLKPSEIKLHKKYEKGDWLAIVLQKVSI